MEKERISHSPAGVEPGSPVRYANKITTTPRPMLSRLVK